MMELKLLNKPNQGEQQERKTEMATKKDKPATKTAKAIKPAAKKGAAAKAAAPKKTPAKKAPAKKPAAKAVKKPAADGSAGDVHEKVQLWKDGPYWATTNIGAEKPEDFGYYFWWGDTVGYKREQDKWVAADGSSSDFSFEGDNTPTTLFGYDVEDEVFGYDVEDDEYVEDDELIENQSSLKDGGWITGDDILAPEHDAAHVQWGGGWRMPTLLELQNLVDKCDWTWKKVNGVKGFVVRGKRAYASASIFLPAADDNAGSYGGYWSSAPYTGFDDSWSLYITSHKYSSSDHSWHLSPRYVGQFVRPVQGFTR